MANNFYIIEVNQWAGLQPALLLGLWRKLIEFVQGDNQQTGLTPAVMFHLLNTLTFVTARLPGILGHAELMLHMHIIKLILM